MTVLEQLRPQAKAGRERETGAFVRAPSVASYTVIAAAAVVWTGAVAALGIWRHEHFLSHRFDLGNMVQAVWSTTQGRPLEMTDGATGEQVARLAAHVDPILLLFTPLWWIHPDPGALIVGYVAVIAAGVYPMVRLALKHTGSQLVAALAGVSYLVYPWTVWIALNELNPVSLALPLLLFAVWFLDEHRLGRFAVAAGLALATGELVGMTVAAIGLWYVLQHRRRVGLAIAGAGAAWTAACIALVLPAFNEGRTSRYYERFETVGGSPLGLLETTVTDPGTVLNAVTTKGDFDYVVLFALPAAFVFLAAPLLALAAIPQLAVNLLSDFPATVSPLYHYSAPLLAPLLAAGVIGLGRIPRRARVLAAGAPVAVSMLFLVAIPPAPGTEDYMFPALEPAARRDAMREALTVVPSSAPVSVSNRLGAHVSARRIVHLFPARRGAEWAVIDMRDPSADAEWVGRVAFERHVERLARDPTWTLVFDRQDVRVYRRQPAAAALDPHR
jgi:uncharacterized membrane protein